MNSIFWYQIAGLIGAVSLQTGFCGVALAVNRRFWPLVLLTMLLVVSSFFSLQAFIPMKLVVMALTVVTIIGGNILFFRNLRLNKNLINAAGWFALIVVGLDGLYSAFPDYRYDQWSYHLLVGKQLARSGPFELPIIFDHIFFSGTYEYLTVIPRYFWDNDLFAHCFSNGFSFLIFATCLFGMTKLFVDEFKIDPRLTMLLTGAILFSIPDHEVLVSSKPDPLLICYAMAIFYLMFSESAPMRTRNILLTLFIAAPAAFKLTWIHFAVSITAAWLVLAALKKWPLSFATVRQLATGVVLALMLSLPFLIRNYKFFGNPVHPVQTIFKSTYWTPGFDSYWQEVSGKALNAVDYFAMLPKLPFAFGKVSAWLLGLIAVIAVVAWRDRNKSGTGRRSEREKWSAWSVTLACFIALWPLFYRSDIYPRFVYPILALSVTVLLMTCGRAQLSPRLALIFLVPLLFNTSLEVKLYRISRAYAEPGLFFGNGRMPYRHWGIDQTLNRHRATTFPGAGYREHRVLSDSHIGYFLDTERLDITSPDFTYFRKTVADASGSECIWHLIDRYDVKYIRSVYEPFASWPAEFQDVINAAEQIDQDNAVRYLSPDVIRENLSRCPNAG